MMHRRHRFPVLVAAVALVPLATVLAQQGDQERERPSLSLRATPPVGFTPLRVRFVVELRGGDDDHPGLLLPVG